MITPSGTFESWRQTFESPGNADKAFENRLVLGQFAENIARNMSLPRKFSEYISDQSNWETRSELLMGKLTDEAMWEKFFEALFKKPIIDDIRYIWFTRDELYP